MSIVLLDHWTSSHYVGVIDKDGRMSVLKKADIVMDDKSKSLNVQG